MINMAQGAGVASDPTIRQDLVRLYTMSQLGRMNQLRVKAARARGEEIAGMGNISKLSMSDMVRLQRDLGLPGAPGVISSTSADDMSIHAVLPVSSTNSMRIASPFVGRSAGQSLPSAKGVSRWCLWCYRGVTRTAVR